MNKKSQLILTNAAMAVIISGSLYLFLNKSERDIKNRIDTVNLNYGYSKGLIEDIKYYKGHSVEVKYRIDDKVHEFSGKWDINPKGLDQGDSVRLRYSFKNPELIITELENEF